MKHPFQNVPDSHFYSVNQFIPETYPFTSVIQLKKKGMVTEGNSSPPAVLLEIKEGDHVKQDRENCSAHFLLLGR